ncbi:MAG: ClpXP protease specificity-enhancing factor SspB [Marinovum sp.]|nr:ClpXP protease specificity-enhancing factor SspB [Marinovum sp.]
MARTIDYGNLMHRAMRGLIKDVLDGVAADGLPGEHHFFITFDTGHPDVELADWLSDRYPDDMMVVMQHWYDNLEVGEDGFAVTLNFGDRPEPLYIPYDAIKTFIDPSVEFGLRFENQDDDDDTPMEPAETITSIDAPERAEETVEQDSEEPKKDADVVSLDAFRK